MIYNKTNYLAPIDYIISSIIREYDISKANISILKKYNIIDNDTYNYYYNADRMTRQISIGLMIRNDPNISEVLKNGIIQAKKELFEYNDIKDYEVLSIKNDAVYIIGRELNVTNCNGIIFVPKNIYTAYYKIKNKEYYYYYNIIDNMEILDIKGISTDRINIHKDYFMDFLKELFLTIQCDNIESAINLLSSFYNSYINMELPLEYYRRFDGESKFDIKLSSMFSTYKADFVSENNKNIIDISYNIGILMDLNKIISGIYFQRNKK